MTNNTRILKMLMGLIALVIALLVVIIIKQGPKPQLVNTPPAPVVEQGAIAAERENDDQLESLNTGALSLTKETHTNQIAHFAGFIEENGHLYGIFDHLQPSQECEVAPSPDAGMCYPSFENNNHKLRIYRFDEKTMYINHDTPVSQEEFLGYDFIYDISWRLYIDVKNGVLTKISYSQAG